MKNIAEKELSTASATARIPFWVIFMSYVNFLFTKLYYERMYIRMESF